MKPDNGCPDLMICEWRLDPRLPQDLPSNEINGRITLLFTDPSVFASSDEVYEAELFCSGRASGSLIGFAKTSLKMEKELVSR